MRWQGRRLTTTTDLNRWIDHNPPRGCILGGGNCFNCQILDDCIWSGRQTLITTALSERYTHNKVGKGEDGEDRLNDDGKGITQGGDN